MLDAAFEKKYLFEHKASIGGKTTIVFSCHFGNGNILTNGSRFVEFCMQIAHVPTNM